MLEALRGWLLERGLNESAADATLRVTLVAIMLTLSAIADRVTRQLLLAWVGKLVAHSRSKWDDVLLERGTFKRAAHLAPAVVTYLLLPVALFGMPQAITIGRHLVLVYALLVFLATIDSFLSAGLDIFEGYDISRKYPARSFVQVTKVLIFCLGAIMAISVVFGRSPLVLLSGLGAMTAVLLLIFKDPIMGLVAGIQLTANNMVTKGDWISMDRYGADGTVLEVALTTVKVQNWDKTIVTIPAYALVSDSFRNWRGMQDSGGRRIKRALSIDMSTVKICDDEMIDRFAKFAYLEGYIAKKAEELRKWNQENGVADSEFKINGRRMTNLGTFRAYLVEYLRQHPMIHQEMTFLVRHLPPTERGLPIEIYVFSKDQAWANYEAIQADIFDHLIAVVPEFDLRVFQLPSGQDLRTLREGFSSTGGSA
jgi:miniconductance mechanosensitive channel